MAPHSAHRRSKSPLDPHIRVAARSGIQAVREAVAAVVVVREARRVAWVVMVVVVTLEELKAEQKAV